MHQPHRHTLPAAPHRQVLAAAHRHGHAVALAPAPSLLRLSAAARLAGAVGIAALLWALVLWAIA